MIFLKKSGNPLLTNQPDISLPNFVGLTESEVTANDDFFYEVEYVYNGEYDKDVVISQKPTAPRTVKKHSTVILKVSQGAMISEMPDLVKEPKIQAQNKLAELGVDVYIRTETMKDFPEGLVIRTEPEAGQTVKSGDVVTIYIAAEEVNRMRISPPVIGLNVEDAKQAISEAGLRSKVILTSSDEPVGTVLWQSYGANAELPVGTLVEINVSAGNE